jgi:hypothetical protein
MKRKNKEIIETRYFNVKSLKVDWEECKGA